MCVSWQKVEGVWQIVDRVWQIVEGVWQKVGGVWQKVGGVWQKDEGVWPQVGIGLYVANMVTGIKAHCMDAAAQLALAGHPNAFSSKPVAVHMHFNIA